MEISGAPWTDESALTRARQVYEAIGQVPITVLKEIEGFILNRLQGALLAEAFRLASEGYVTPQDLDRTVADGLGLRWSFMGPFETIETQRAGRHRRLLFPLHRVLQAARRGACSAHGLRAGGGRCDPVAMDRAG